MSSLSFILYCIYFLLVLIEVFLAATQDLKDQFMDKIHVRPVAIGLWLLLVDVEPHAEEVRTVCQLHTYPCVVFFFPLTITISNCTQTNKQTSPFKIPNFFFWPLNHE